MRETGYYWIRNYESWRIYYWDSIMKSFISPFYTYTEEEVLEIDEKQIKRE